MRKVPRKVEYVIFSPMNIAANRIAKKGLDPIIEELTATPSLSIDMKLNNLPRVEARIPEATKKTTPLKLSSEGILVRNKPVKTETCTKEVINVPVIGFESSMPFKLSIALAP
jgi:hypothetical protein